MMLVFARLFLFGCCLSWYVHTTVGYGVSGTAELDSFASIMDIQRKLLKIQAELPPISATAAVSDNFDNVLAHVDSLDEEIQRLKEYLNVIRPRISIDSKLNIGVKLLINHVDAVETQLLKFRLDIKGKKEAFIKRKLPSEIVAAIQHGEFSVAEDKLMELNDYDEIPKIVQAVYANSTTNFGLLVGFTRNLTKVSSSYHVLKALNDEMRRNKHQDPVRMMILVKLMELEVISQPNSSPDIKAEAQMLNEGILALAKASAEETLRKAMSVGTFERGGEVDVLTNSIKLFRPELSDEIMEHIINATYGMVPSKKILDNISSYRSLESVVTGIRILFEKIKDAGNLNTEATIHVAAHLRRLQLNQNYTNISQDTQDIVTKLVTDLPACARNLYFQPSVCFWNRAEEEYLYAADSSHNYDKDRRRVLSGEDVMLGSHWHAEQIGNSFFFKNREYPDEYLYAAAIDFNKDMRYILNWIPGNNTDGQSAWSIELNGDYCYLRSVYFNEYLFASNLMRPNGVDMRYVFLWKPGTSVRGTEFQWQIRNCD